MSDIANQGQQAMDRVVDISRSASDAGTAVLLVESGSAEIVYTNHVARQLAPNMQLPAPLDEWADGAGLLDSGGYKLSSTEQPLSVIVGQGNGAGRMVAVPGSSNARQRTYLWTLFVPLSDAPGLEQFCLVVFLPVDGRKQVHSAADETQSQFELRDRAVLATDVSFTVADASIEDMPLVWVNPGFTATTGYSFSEAVGHNCRFLQGKDTDVAARKQLRAAINNAEATTVTLLNYRKDGTPFWNRVSMNPVLDANGDLSHFVGIQSDVTGAVETSLERDRALDRERVARQETELARKQIALIADATEKLAFTLDPSKSLATLSELLVPDMADWALIASISGSGSVNDVRAHHRDGKPVAMERIAEGIRKGFAPGSAIHSILFDRAAGIIVQDYSSDSQKTQRKEWLNDPAITEVSDLLGAESAMIVPLPGHQYVNGVMLLFREQNSGPYTEQDLAVANDLGRRAGLIIDNSRLYQAEHHIAETLQRSLLPRIPDIDGVRAAVKYRTSETTASVGGDFYDLLPLSDGAVGVMIGDVVGHDILAAATMGQLHGLLRACAWDSPENFKSGDPADVLQKVDEMIEGLDMAAMATVAYGSIKRIDDSEWMLRYSSAGHLPLMVRHRDGRVTVLDEARGVLLGAQVQKRTSSSVILESGAIVVAYTDGLIERRDTALTESLEELERAVADGPAAPDQLCDHLLNRFSVTDDDVALLAVELL